MVVIQVLQDNYFRLKIFVGILFTLVLTEAIYGTCIVQVINRHTHPHLTMENPLMIK